MALNAYLKLKGQKQGEIKGSVIQKGREGKIAVIAVEHALSVPRDAATGQATGKRMHRPFSVTKALDASTPLLYSALVNNELMTEFELQFWTPQARAGAGSGIEVQHYTVRLFNARLVDSRFHLPDNRNPDLLKYTEYEELSFVYGRIEWTWVAGGITADDVWPGAGGSSKLAAEPAAKPAARPAARPAVKKPAKAPAADIAVGVRRRKV